ncbi:MAG: thiamine-phosphate kinase [Candidatus Sulfotelmatobacter sp.]
MVLPEKTLIAQIRRAAKRTSFSTSAKKSAIQTGIGDDCAIVRPPSFAGKPTDILITSDFTLEGIHFLRHWHSAESVGHRCLARGLSDIAAMGGDPIAAFLSLALPRDLPQAWVQRFITSLLSLAEKYGVTLAGGDTAESPGGILADIIVMGAVPKGRALLRAGARPGDRIYVSGELGGSAAAVLGMQNNPRRKLNPRDYPRHFFPEPRVRLGRILREKRLASAMIDTSDGVSTDLHHICEESGVGAELQAEAIPRASVGKPAHVVDLELALHGGEDYELLFTARPNQAIPGRIAGTRLTQIGRITRGRDMLLRCGETTHKLKPRGWEHFRKT